MINFISYSDLTNDEKSVYNQRYLICRYYKGLATILIYETTLDITISSRITNRGYILYIERSLVSNISKFLYEILSLIGSLGVESLKEEVAIIDSKFIPRDWQYRLLTELEGSPVSKIIWYVDIEGGSGKSTLSRFIASQRPDSLCINNDFSYYRICRNLSTYTTLRLIIFDIPLAECKSNSLYNILTAINDRYLTSLTSTIVLKDLHIVVLSNFQPDMKLISFKKLDIRVLERTNDSYNVKYQ